MYRSVLVVIVGALIAGACAHRGNAVLDNVPGCYDLHFGEWNHQVGGRPPARIALDTVKPEGPLIRWSVNPHRVRPNIAQTRTSHPDAIWYADTLNALHIIWNTGYSGYELEMTREADGDLAGIMTHFTDSRPSLPTTATVRAHRIDCVAAGLQESP